MIAFVKSLFRPKSRWLGQQVKAWHYTQWGVTRIEGRVIRAEGKSLTIRYKDGAAFATVWEHDTVLASEELPTLQEGWYE